MRCRHSSLRGPLRPDGCVGKTLLVGLLVLFHGFLPPGWPGTVAYAQSTSPLQVAVIQGKDRVVRKRDDLRLVVEVRNDQKAPVAGAEVTFLAPEAGPGILFAGNSNHMTVKTDSSGRANAGLTRAVGDGAYVVTIVASYQGQTASTSAEAVNQTSPPPAKKSSAMKWILIAAAGGAAAAVLATRKSDSSPSSSGGSSSGGAITAGPPTVGPPQ